jgi:hypothetical protein
MNIYAKVRTALFVLMMLPLSVLSGTLTAAAQQPSTPKPVIVEWVYRTKYGYKDEWWRICKKYQLAILERQKQLGYVEEYSVYAPSVHTSEDSRWDYRVIIVRSSQDAPPEQAESEVARQLFPDQETFTREENGGNRIKQRCIHEIDSIGIFPLSGCVRLASMGTSCYRPCLFSSIRPATKASMSSRLL